MVNSVVRYLVNVGTQDRFFPFNPWITNLQQMYCERISDLEISNVMVKGCSNLGLLSFREKCCVSRKYFFKKSFS